VPFDFLATHGVAVDAAQREQLAELIRRMLDFNQHTNLTALRDFDAAMMGHIVDSLLPLPALPFAAGARVLDMGTGAGFPGLPLAILRPEWSFLLVDSTAKKLRFVRETLDWLALPNTDVQHARVEEMVAHRGTFDGITARAVAPLEKLVGWAAPLLRQGGRACFYKGPKAADELHAAEAARRRAGFAAPETHEFALPDGSQRVLVTYRKAVE